MNRTLHVGPLRPEHAGELLTVQRAAYVSEAQRYREPGIPPLVETLDQIRADLADPLVPAVGAWLGDRLAGSVRGRPDGARMEIARFAVAPDLQGRGVGRRLLEAVEAAAPAPVRVLWLVAGSASADNLRLYQRMGYHPTGTMVDNVGITLDILEKALGKSTGAGSSAPCVMAG